MSDGHHVVGSGAPSAPTANPLFKEHPAITRLSPQLTEALKESGFTSICMVGSKGLVPRALGDAKGVRPVKWTVASKWPDTVSTPVDRNSPIGGYALLFRVWLRSAEQARRLLVEMPPLLAGRASPMRGDWFDLNAKTDLDMLRLEIEELAQSLGLETFDDDALLAVLDNPAVEH